MDTPIRVRRGPPASRSLLFQKADAPPWSRALATVRFGQERQEAQQEGGAPQAPGRLRDRADVGRAPAEGDEELRPLRRAELERGAGPAQLSADPLLHHAQEAG